MKRRLFLTGDMGCGKSTAIRQALGDRMGRCGGFLTQRVYDDEGVLQGFQICSTDGSKSMDFLVFFDGKPMIYPVSFETLGVSLLEGQALILDEIGGVELFCPRFTAALYAVLESGVPILGVLKGEQPRTAMTEKLHLRQNYTVAAQALRQKLQEDPDTLIYECGQYDKNALLLARQWAEEYCHD
jgi:nucleoside-triphosphatase THEP1